MEAKKDTWKDQISKSKKRKHKQAFGQGRVNWQEKRDKKRAKKLEQAQGVTVEPYEINTYVIGSERFNEYYKVS